MQHSQRERLIDRIALALSWADRTRNDKDAYLYRARVVADQLLSASAEGKAVERALKVIEKQEVA